MVAGPGKHNKMTDKCLGIHSLPTRSIVYQKKNKALGTRHHLSSYLTISLWRYKYMSPLVSQRRLKSLLDFIYDKRNCRGNELRNITNPKALSGYFYLEPPPPQKKEKCLSHINGKCRYFSMRLHVNGWAFIRMINEMWSMQVLEVWRQRFCSN